MEMSRQRLRPSLQERWTQDVASLSTAVLRLIEEEASKKKAVKCELSYHLICQHSY